LNRLVSCSRRLRSPSRRVPKSQKKDRNKKERTRVVDLDESGSPVDLLSGGEHFNDCPPRPVYDENETDFAMDKMLRMVKDNELTRPTVR